ncbi:hypothetical protein [Allosphingosinicella vermicomposti]|uniref:hypothetical protein n=1 Tax=Allosphingosinicella vermicomposti TaxID=614671 RepID=UPI001FE156E3|nr:hypothetical protein [Allosphingosinicella vermicomposti]
MTMNAKEASDRAGNGKMVIGWALDLSQRRELLQQFPPKYGEVVADHVTLKAHTSRDAGLPSETEGEIVGRSDDGKGVEALVVRIDGTTDRPDGSTYHITWSLAEGRRARESNDVIAAFGWAPIALPMPILLQPKRFP